MDVVALCINAAAAAGTWLFTVNGDAFPQVTDPSLAQCIALGVAVAATAIVPGVDPAVFLSSLGFYEMYVGALASLELSVLAPMVIGLAAGAVGISFVMSLLFKRFYTGTFSVIFGIFLSMIPNMLSPACVPGFNAETALSLVLLIAGFALSYYLGDIQGNNARLKRLFKR